MIRLKRLPLEAGVLQSFALSGNYFRILAADGVVTVKFDSGGTAEMLAGLGFQSPQPFQTLTLLSEISQTIHIAVSVGKVDDSRLVGKINIADALRVIAEPSNTCTILNTTATTTATECRPATAKRRYATLQAVDGNIYIGTDNTVTTATGLVCPAGGSVTLSHTQAIYVIAAANVDVRYVEEINP